MGVWITSDEHFYHKNIIKLAKRPFSNLEEMHATLIKNHNKAVEEEDLVIHLGDFCFGAGGRYREILSQLNGQHILILGNHDKIGYIAGMNAGFTAVLVEAKIRIAGKSVLLKHYPYKPSFWGRLKLRFFKKVELRYMERRPKNEGGWLLSGHTHSKIKALDRQIHVGVDAWGFRPVSLCQIESMIMKKERK